ncbi:MAG TPA: hypothetical protein PKX38_00880 [Alphaproteobacteria bacterium]|nr:hypothetical protein [Alphaproteobacteria bacterium]
MPTLLPQDSDSNVIPAMRLMPSGGHHISATSSSARNSTDFNSNTRVVSVYATEPVYIKFGDSSVTAAATDHYFPAGVYYDFAIGGDRTGIIRALRCCA